jgi:hypothetical protein
MTLLYNEEENNLEIFAKYQQFDLELKDRDDIPWQITSTLKPRKSYEPKIGKRVDYLKYKIIPMIIFR